MRILALIFALSLAAAAHAFDSEAWLAKRAMLEHEAERLRAEYTNCVSRLETPAEDVKVPIEVYPDGSIKSSISAKRAQFFLDTGYVWGEDVVVTQYRADGSLEGEVRAKNCVIDRTTRSGWVEGQATALYGKTTLSGDGIYFSFSEEFVKIMSKVEIKSADLKIKGVKL